MGNQSTAVLDSTDQATTSFTPDMAGIYKVQLVVYDTKNASSLPFVSYITVRRP